MCGVCVCVCVVCVCVWGGGGEDDTPRALDPELGDRN